MAQYQGCGKISTPLLCVAVWAMTEPVMVTELYMSTRKEIRILMQNENDC